MPRGNRFRRHAYRSERPTSPFRLLRSGAPSDPSSADFAARMAAAGAAMSRATVAAIYLVHGTFCGTDFLGLLTELARFAPRLSESLRRRTKSVFDAAIGETGNYPPQFAVRME